MSVSLSSCAYQSDKMLLCEAGADSLGNDKLGDFNLTIRTHAAAVAFMKSFNIPMLVTGGKQFSKKFFLDLPPLCTPIMV